MLSHLRLKYEYILCADFPVHFPFRLHPTSGAFCAFAIETMSSRPNLAGVDLLATAKCRTLHNGVKLPMIGLGTWRLRGDRLRSGVFGALNERYALIDSAAAYGNEEEIRELLKEAGSPVSLASSSYFRK